MAKIFSNCIITKGATKSIIIDYQRKQYFWFENKYLSIIEKIRELGDLKKVQKWCSDNGINEDYKDTIQFLENNELTFYNSAHGEFPDINLDYSSPELINNSILDYSNESEYNLLNAINKLSILRCKHYQVRFFSEVSFELINNVLTCLHIDDYCLSVELYIKESKELATDSLEPLIYTFPKIKTIIIHSSREDSIVKRHDESQRFEMGNLITTKQCIHDEMHCGFISKDYFSYKNLKSIIESKNRNSCLNKKISIDKNGMIKNCPVFTNAFGHIDEIEDLNQIIDSEFKKLWMITKDAVKTCKDCEFRYICSDCRAITIENDILEKPKNCNYDPYEQT